MIPETSLVHQTESNNSTNNSSPKWSTKEKLLLISFALINGDSNWSYLCDQLNKELTINSNSRKTKTECSKQYRQLIKQYTSKSSDGHFDLKKIYSDLAEERLHEIKSLILKSKQEFQDLCCELDNLINLELNNSSSNFKLLIKKWIYLKSSDSMLKNLDTDDKYNQNLIDSLNIIKQTLFSNQQKDDLNLNQLILNNLIEKSDLQKKIDLELKQKYEQEQLEKQKQIELVIESELENELRQILNLDSEIEKELEKLIKAQIELEREEKSKIKIESIEQQDVEMKQEMEQREEEEELEEQSKTIVLTSSKEEQDQVGQQVQQQEEENSKDSSKFSSEDDMPLVQIIKNKSEKINQQEAKVEAEWKPSLEATQVLTNNPSSSSPSSSLNVQNESSSLESENQKSANKLKQPENKIKPRRSLRRSVLDSSSSSKVSSSASSCSVSVSSSSSVSDLDEENQVNKKSTAQSASSISSSASLSSTKVIKPSSPKPQTDEQIELIFAPSIKPNAQNQNDSEETNKDDDMIKKSTQIYDNLDDNNLNENIFDSKDKTAPKSSNKRSSTDTNSNQRVISLRSSTNQQKRKSVASSSSSSNKTKDEETIKQDSIDAGTNQTTGGELISINIKEEPNQTGVVNEPEQQGAKGFDDEKAYRAWKKSIMMILNNISCHKHATIFMQPVKDEIAPGYSTLIHRPIDLSTIKKNLENGFIKSTKEFQRDVMLMFTNALMYNSSNHNIHKISLEMFKEVLSDIEQLLNAQEAMGSNDEHSISENMSSNLSLGSKPLRYKDIRSSSTTSNDKSSILNETKEEKNSKDESFNNNKDDNISIKSCSSISTPRTSNSNSNKKASTSSNKNSKLDTSTTSSTASSKKRRPSTTKEEETVQQEPKNKRRKSGR